MENKKDDLFDDLKAAGYGFKVRGSKMSGRWQRAIAKDAKLKQRYGEAKGDTTLQATIRAEWGKEEYDAYEANRSKTLTQTHQQFDKSAYLAPKRIAWKEGGGKSGWRNAVNICLDAQTVGGKMIYYDGRAKAWKYLYNVKGYEDTLAEAYAIHEAWCKKARATEDEGEEDEDDEGGEDAGPPKAKGQPKAKAGAAKAKAKSGQNNSPPTKKPKPEDAKTIAKALKLKGS